MNNSGV